MHRKLQLDDVWHHLAQDSVCQVVSRNLHGSQGSQLSFPAVMTPVLGSYMRAVQDPRPTMTSMNLAPRQA